MGGEDKKVSGPPQVPNPSDRPAGGQYNTFKRKLRAMHLASENGTRVISILLPMEVLGRPRWPLGGQSSGETLSQRGKP